MKARSLEEWKRRRFRSPRTIVRTIVFLAAVILLNVITGCGPQTAFAPPEANAAVPIEALQQATEELRRTSEELQRASEKLQQASAELRRTDEKRRTKTDFIDYVQHMDTAYMFEEYYGIDVALAHDFQMPVVTEHAHPELMSLDTLDADTVYALIVRNNKQFKPQYKSLSIWDDPETLYDIDEKLLHKYAAIVCEVINDALADDPRIDRESLLCRVANLKILFSDTRNYNGKLTNDGAIILYPESIDAMIKRGFDNHDMYEYFFRHELEHLFHLFCEDEKAEGLLKGGVGIRFDGDERNPLLWNWFYECSAEKTAMNSMHSDPSTYFVGVSYIDSMTFSFLPDPNVSCTTLESIHRPREQQLFFDLFANLKQDEVIKMMYALDMVITSPYETTTVVKLGTAGSGTEVTDKTFRSNLEADALESMSKNLYLNLLYRIDGRNVELDDILHIIRLWEFDINSHIAYYAEEKVKINEDFVEKYSDMQTEFFRYLCARFGLTLSELDAMLLDYDPRVLREIPWLDQEKNLFLVYLAEKNAEYMTRPDGTLRYPIRYYNGILEKRRTEAAA